MIKIHFRQSTPSRCQPILCVALSSRINAQSMRQIVPPLR